LEQHTYLDLDGDGYEEPYIVTVHEDSGEVLRIVKRYDENSISFLGDTDVVLKISPIEYFTKFGFIPSPDGSFYDIGFGTLLGPINNTINTTLNQLLDAGTLSNMQAGFISNGLRIKGGNNAFKPGEFKTVQSIGTSIKDSVMLLPLANPSSVLFNLLSTMITAGEKLSSVTDMMTGEIPGQNTKATVAVTAIEQGMKVFNAIYKRIHRSLKQEFKKLYALNARYLPSIGYFNMLGVNAAAPISKGDYQVGDIDVMPYSDPNIATEAQKISKLELLQPLLAMGTIDPMEYTLRYLEATEQPNMDKLLAKPSGPSPEMQKIQAELELKNKDLDIKVQTETLKLQIADKLANAKVSKDEIDSVVALMELALSQQQAEQEVKASKMEASKTE
jgi:chaperonin GroES